MKSVSTLTDKDKKDIEDILNDEFKNDHYDLDINYDKEKGMQLGLCHDDSQFEDIPFEIFYRAIELLKKYGYGTK